ncbi:MAG TPA: aspartyl protease family protein [Blastocatellia bacterium]|nr:aspartyl protease family protein [Blastocatellia bacterium]HMX25738.1 aspartyl protease family protein [Blastocatellia bacterium]HMY72079.1 aspartyl protease family protein [Blastocatellia bacterium]HMZ17378.1 aspartyl protease family protein [Blastocatellia bacterium]HNG28619.1 aspartyl protease family protein [Blastocatellia bacterium]
MGQVRTQLTITNRLDEGLAERGVITSDQVRKVTLDSVLADTGAMMLSLPIRIIEQLGLTPLKEVLASTAAGYQRTRVFQDAKVSIGDRVGVFQCLELPGGDNPLLGVIPMEELGLELDLQKQELKMLPMEPGNSYLLAYGHTLHNLDGTLLDENELRSK